MVLDGLTHSAAYSTGTMSPWSNGTLSLLLIALGGVHLVGGFERELSSV